MKEITFEPRRQPWEPKRPLVCHTCGGPFEAWTGAETICLNCLEAWLDRQVHNLAFARKRALETLSKAESGGEG